MTSIIYDSAVNDTVVNNINFGSDTFYAMLVTSSYTPSKTTHTKRSDVTNESTGTGYTAGGSATAATVVNDTANNKVTISFASVSWTTATLTAAAAVIYKAPSATLDYSINWNDANDKWLKDGETIITSVWASSSVDITLAFPANDGYKTTIWASGGIAGTDYILTNTITTSDNRIDERSITLSCEYR